ncbi:Dynein assembly factor with WDR repeat domains 1 [Collichthys lucidus]|uniref:Dynein assembly factor with WD repeat domains 1 n=1 Tax=Collichthys lucidus TaxID=240159 RepID=A0A4U5V242_COLLU|nr:Dynein assembly factor with WDR repeat domains 1 [Collichthys lucidus]
MKLKRFLLRYYPPGIILEYDKGGNLRTKSIDLLDLTPETNPDELFAEIRQSEPLITESRADQVKQLIIRLQQKQVQHDHHKFCFSKVCMAFNPQSTLVATGSMDATAKLWDVETGEEVATLTGHTAEVLFLCFNTVGNQLVTGSFDHTVAIWDVASRRRVHTLIGHTGEISNVQFNWDCSLIVTASIDKTCKVNYHVLAFVFMWEAVSGKCVATLAGHKEEVLDVCFDLRGQLIASASADGTARVFSATTHQCLATLEGHDGEISKICFSPQGNRILTASSDKTARLWDVQTGVCLQVLEGHTDEIFSCVFNYEGDTIITGSKDNTCRIWC